MAGNDSDEVLLLLKRARDVSGMPLDFWVDLTEGLDYSALAILCGNASVFPKYKNSRLKP